MISLRRRVGLGLLALAGLCALHLPLPAGGEAAAQGRKAKPAPKKPGAKKSAEAKGEAIDVGEASWPQFLGAGRDNLSKETGLLGKWPAGGPKLLSTFKGLGIGFSNIAIDDNVVFTMGTRGAREYVIAISLETGEPVWQYDNAAAYHNDYGDGPRGTPTLDDGRVYALGATGQLVCLEADSGKPVWSKSLPREFGTQIPQWGLCESVLIDGARAVCTPGGPRGLMVAFDKKSGEILWKAAGGPADGAAYASAIAVDAGGVRQYVNFTSGHVIGVRADDGKVLWNDADSANGIANCCAPVFSDGMLFTASGYSKGGSGVLLSSSAANSTSAHHKYHSNDLQVHHGGLVLFEGHVYATNDQSLICMELKTGKKKWQSRSVGKGSLTCADGHLIVRSEGGPVALVAATPASYKELGRFTPGDRSDSAAWTYPVVCGGKLFLRDQDILQVYDIQEK